MKKLLPVLFALFSLVFFARAQTANVLVSLQDFVSTPQIYQAVTLTPLAPYGLNGSTIAIPNARTFLTGTNSSVTFSNTLMGYTYKLSIKANNWNENGNEFDITLAFPVSLAGTNTINASSWTWYNFITLGPVSVTPYAQSNLVSLSQVNLAASNAQAQAQNFAVLTDQTNSAKYQPASTILTNLAGTGAVTNLAAGAGISVTGTGGNLTIAATGAGGAATNVFVGPGANVSITTNGPGSWTIAANSQTNGFTPIVLTQPSAYDAANAAKNATNGLGLAAFTSPSAYDPSGSALAGTNTLWGWALLLFQTASGFSTSTNLWWGNTLGLVNAQSNAAVGSAITGAQSIINSSNALTLNREFALSNAAAANGALMGASSAQVTLGLTNTSVMTAMNAASNVNAQANAGTSNSIPAAVQAGIFSSTTNAPGLSVGYSVSATNAPDGNKIASLTQVSAASNTVANLITTSLDPGTNAVLGWIAATNATMVTQLGLTNTAIQVAVTAQSNVLGATIIATNVSTVARELVVSAAAALAATNPVPTWINTASNGVNSAALARENSLLSSTNGAANNLTLSGNLTNGTMTLFAPNANYLGVSGPGWGGYALVTTGVFTNCQQNGWSINISGSTAVLESNMQTISTLTNGPIGTFVNGSVCWTGYTEQTSGRQFVGEFVATNLTAQWRGDIGTYITAVSNHFNTFPYGNGNYSTLSGYSTNSGSAATAMSLSKVYSGINVAFVDCINGSNSVAQLGNETYPFRDFSNAVAAIASGGVVVLTPGQSNLIGSLVSISNDITIIGCGAWVVNTNTSNPSIFDVKGFNTVFTIIGGAYMSMGGNSYGTQLGVDSTNGDIKLYNANFFGVTDGMQCYGWSNHVYAVGCDCESYWDTSSGGNPTDSGLFQSCKFHSKADPAHSNPNGTELDCVSHSGGSWKYQACDFWSSNAVTINFGILNSGATIELDNCSLEIGSTNSGAAILLFYSPLPPAGAITIFNNSTVNGQLYNGTYVDGFLTNTGVPSILSPVMSPNVTSFAGTFYSLTISGSTNASVNIAPYLPGPSFGHPNVYVWTNSAGICVVSNDPGASGFYIVERTNDINQQTGNVLLVPTIRQASTPPWGNLSDYTDAASDTNVFIFPSALQYIPACSVGTNFIGNGSGLTNITPASIVGAATTNYTITAGPTLYITNGLIIKIQ